MQITWRNLDGTPVQVKACRHCGKDVSTLPHRMTEAGPGCFGCEIERDPEWAARMRR